VVSTGRTASSVAAEVGLHHTLLSRWLRRENERLRMERDILEKGTAIFAVRSR